MVNLVKLVKLETTSFCHTIMQSTKQYVIFRNVTKIFKENLRLKNHLLELNFKFQNRCNIKQKRKVDETQKNFVKPSYFYTLRRT